MKKLIMMLLTAATTASIAQNVGIGISNPVRAKLEVWGVAGTGNTAGYFGEERGISLQRNYAAIGLNQYKDNSTYGRYMGIGYAGLWSHVHDDPTLAQGLTYTIFPPGTSDAVIPYGTKLWDLSINSRFRILTSMIVGVSGILDVGRGTGSEGAGMIAGTNFNSHFNYSTSEHTYIRGGKAGSNLYLNDIPNGNVVFGNGAATLGINTNNYVPPTTLEVRQSNGGMELTNATYPTLPMEWRVANGSPANFYLYYANSVRTYFSYTNGALHPVSDARIKTNVQALPPLLNKLMQLRPVTYLMKDALEEQGRSVGFLAQDVQKLFPLLVATHMDDKRDLLGLNYNGFNVLAIKGIQEEQLQLNDLDKELAEMDNRLKKAEQILSSRKH